MKSTIHLVMLVIVLYALYACGRDCPYNQEPTFSLSVLEREMVYTGREYNDSLNIWDSTFEERIHEAYLIYDRIWADHQVKAMDDLYNVDNQMIEVMLPVDMSHDYTRYYLETETHTDTLTLRYTRRSEFDGNTCQVVIYFDQVEVTSNLDIQQALMELDVENENRISLIR